MQSRGAPKGVVRVVVVDVARRVHVPRVVGVATVARAEPPVATSNLRPIFCYVAFMPCGDGPLSLNGELCPVSDLRGFQVE